MAKMFAKCRKISKNGNLKIQIYESNDVIILRGHEILNKTLGGSNPIFAHGKNVSFPIFPHGKKLAVGNYMEREALKSIHFPLFPYTFFPIFPMGEKSSEKTHFFHGQKWGLDPPPNAVFC